MLLSFISFKFSQAQTVTVVNGRISPIGNLNPNGSVSINYGDTLRYIYFPGPNPNSPADGYVLDSVIVDGTLIAKDTGGNYGPLHSSGYTLQNVTPASSLRVVYRLKTFGITQRVVLKRPGLPDSILFFTVGKNDNAVNLIEPKKFNFDFSVNAEGWLGDFADYPNEPGVENFYEFVYSYSTLPSPLNNSDGALKQSGNNHSDDLFMFVKKKITGLKANTSYNVEVEIEFATNASSGAIGVGGSPGESVYIKAGASTIEPMKVLDNSDNHYRMNIDKGNQAIDGANMKLIGNFANETDFNVYKLKVLKTTNPVHVVSNSNGELWVIVGTDSGFEATTTIYYNRITVTVK